MGSLKGVTLTPLKIIEGESGNVLHALKHAEASFSGFGEAYFSTVQKGAVKGWKNHQRMTLNVIVPVGRIQFVLYDEAADEWMECIISRTNYQRLTVSPGIWMAFKGLDEGLNMLLNIASIPHDPAEALNLPIKNDRFAYKGFE